MLMEHVNLAEVSDPNGLLAAIKNHFTCGIYSGNRTCKWAQTDKCRSKLGSKHRLNKKGNPYVYNLRRISFCTVKALPYPLKRVVSDPLTLPGLAIVVFDWQKNGDHGEDKKFARNDKKPHLCFVHNQMAIIQCFVALVGWNYNLPLSIYLPKNSTVPQSITSTEIKYIMNMLAKCVCHLDPKKPADAKILKKWGGTLSMLVPAPTCTQQASLRWN